MPKESTEESAGGRFPATRGSAVMAARSGDPEERQRAFDRIVSAYWKPIYKYIRVRWRKNPEDAQDLTQEFFARAIEKNYLAGYDPERARLRTYLRACTDNLIANEDRAARAIKRGGQTCVVSLDFETVEGELRNTHPPATEDVEAFFEKEWVRSLFGMALEQLRQDCVEKGKAVHFLLFERYDLEPAGELRPSYSDLALEFDIPLTDVTNHLSYARRTFRRITLEILRELTASEEEFQREARALLGVETT